MTRRAIGSDAETSVLLQSRRRCAICFGLDGDDRSKPGQIAHLDRDPSNSVAANLVFLCLPHHDAYDSTTSQSKGFREAEVRAFREWLYSFVEQMPAGWPDPGEIEPLTGKEVSGPLNPEVYDRKIAVYRATRDFVSSIIRDAKVDLGELARFAQDTDEALFLFDGSVDASLRELYSRAVLLYTAGKRLDAARAVDAEAVQLAAAEDEKGLAWFTEQMPILRRLFRAYVHLP